MNVKYSMSCFVGVTSRGNEMPVFWDAHTQIYNVGAPTTLVSGEPGTGKTFLLLTMTSHKILCGSTNIVLDPKGDFLPLINLRDEFGKIRLWNIGDSNNKKSRTRGLLDPFYMTSDKGEQLELVIATITMLLGELRDDQMQALAPIIKDVAELDRPNMLAVVDQCRTSQNPVARQIGTQLDIIARLPAAGACFSSGTKKRNPVDLTTGTTIITMAGLDLPQAGQKKLTNKQRLAITMFFLVTDFIRRTMNQTDDTVNKTVIIDEAWAVVASPAGQDTIKALALLGRSKNLALILATQTPLHLKGTEIDNTIKTRFAFRTSRDDAKQIVEAMRLPSYGGFDELLCDLGRGECLMADAYGRYSTVQITNYDKRWNVAFETNPAEKIAAEKAAKAQQARQALSQQEMGTS